MSELITGILRMSLMGSIVIAVVLVARLFMRRLPKKFLYALWLIVAFRLLCPFSIESDLSIFNLEPIKQSVETVEQAPAARWAPSGNWEKVEISKANPQPAEVEATKTSVPVEVVKTADITPVVLISAWILIMVGIMIYAVTRYATIKRKLTGLTEIEPRVYAGHAVDSPFVLGVIRPDIYMPAGLTEDELRYLLLHEKIHVKRGDTIFKAIGIMCLAIHWFNPLVWIAFFLFCRDMEMSCDEAVIAELGDNVKADYSMSLVSFARKEKTNQYIITPIAFTGKILGRSEVKMRIKNVLSYKKSSKLLAIIAFILVATIGVACFFNGKSRADENDGEAKEPEHKTFVAAGNDAAEEEGAYAKYDDDAIVEEADIFGEEVVPEDTADIEEDLATAVVIHDEDELGSEVPAEAEEAAAAEEEVLVEETAVEVNAVVEGRWKTEHSDLLNADLLVPALPSDYTGDIAAGTYVDGSNYLDRLFQSESTVPVDSFNSFLYCTDSVALSDAECDAFVAELQAMGFNGELWRNSDEEGSASVFDGVRDDGLCVYFENCTSIYEESTYYKITYVYNADGANDRYFRTVG